MDKKKLMWGAISLILAIMTIWAVTMQGEKVSFEMLINLISKANKFWLLVALIMMFGFIWFEGRAVVRIASSLGYDKKLNSGVLYGAADVFFSAITPSASGGQPASAYFMHRDGMRGSAITTSLLLNLIMYTLALFCVGVISMFMQFDFLLSFQGISKILIGVGFFILIFLTSTFYLLLCRADVLYNFCNNMLKLLEKLHIVRKLEQKQEKLKHTLQDYKECADAMIGNKRMLLDAFLLNLLQRLSHLGVTFAIFMAMGKSVDLAIKSVYMQCFVAIGSNSIPIPGGMGAADYLMLDGFSILIGGDESVVMELLCRGVSFYGSVTLSAILVIAGYFMRKGKRKC